MADPVEIDLSVVRFETSPTVLLQANGITAHVFRCATGIEAVRITTRVGKITILPFKGQQVWDVEFHGRRLTMQSMFDEPQATTDYLSTYGAFLIHCGASAMGAPGPSDTHPLHGELPNARFQTAKLIIGEDDTGSYLSLAGSCRQTRAFSYNYVFHAAVTVRPDVTHLDVAVSIDNLMQTPFDAMYLAHINFRPVDNGRLVDTVKNDRTDIELRRSHPPGLAVSNHQLRLVDALIADPSLHRQFKLGGRIDPEVVLFLACQTDADGWAYGAQVHPGGEADFVRYRPSELPVAVRWISRTGDQDALGIILPSTSGIEGYTAEKGKGRVVTMPGHGSYSCHYRCGALDASDANHLLRHIESIKANNKSMAMQHFDRAR